MPPRTLEYMPLADIRRAALNPKRHDAAGIAASFARFGLIEVITVDERTGRLVSGHGRLDQLEAGQAAGETVPEGVELGEAGEWLAPVLRGWRSANDAEAHAAGVALNRLVERGGWDQEELVATLTQLAASDAGLAGTGYADDDLAAALAALAEPERPQPSPTDETRAAAQTLASRFLVPPFSVLDARQGYWQDRKRAWLALGIRSEEGRPRNLLKMSDQVLASQTPNRSRPGAGAHLSASGSADFYTRKRRLEAELGRELTTAEATTQLAERERRPQRSTPRRNNDKANRSVPNSHSGNDPSYYWKKQEAERAAGRPLTNAEFEADWFQPEAYVGGTSIFDPVLCEVAYRWFCPPAGRVVDPFAGGSVRGIVAAWLGLAYTGVDLRAEQTAANDEQWAAIAKMHPGQPGTAEWLTGDSRDALPGLGAADLVFSCPPYFDLEQYSDDPADLSNAGSYDAFLDAYATIIDRSVALLADDRFAVFVVGDIRGPDGSYRGLCADTIRLFGKAGAAHHNDAILVTAVGSLALRAARIFGGARRLAKAHQNVLVFVKGDPRKAVEACGPVEVADPAALFGDLAAVE